MSRVGFREDRVLRWKYAFVFGVGERGKSGEI